MNAIAKGANDVENNRLGKPGLEANAQNNANAAAARETAGFQNRAAEAKDQAAAAALQQQRAGERDSQGANDVENNRLANQAAQVGQKTLHSMPSVRAKRIDDNGSRNRRSTNFSYGRVWHDLIRNCSKIRHYS